MFELKGKTISSGIVSGKISIYTNEKPKVIRKHRINSSIEKERFDKSRKFAIIELKKLYEYALKDIGKFSASIFEAQQTMLEDFSYIEAVYHIIENELVNAEYAVATTSDNFSNMFLAIDDPYIRQKSADIIDISDRIIANLTNTNYVKQSNTKTIVVANDLSPSEIIKLNKSNTLAIILKNGSMNSHISILAKAMGIPTIFEVKDINFNSINNMFAIVDAFNDKIILNPTSEVINFYNTSSIKSSPSSKSDLLKTKPCITKDGKEIMLYANINNVSEVFYALNNNADGVGLFRSEFLYLGKNDYPSENEQFQVYRTLARNMAGKRVIIRTLDVGADKQADYFDLAKENNSAMGYRAIRICLDRQNMFKTQLKAILRASIYGKIGIMFPMIISVNELHKIKVILKDVENDLAKNNIKIGTYEIGVMIETPAAVMISDLLAKEVDFLSIGTNDLTQYTLAIDRQNAKLENIYDSHHLAIIRMIQMVINNGHKENCFVGICGELASDTTLTKKFIHMGIDELSVSPASLLEIKELIIS